MPQILLVNPSKRGTRTKSRRKTSTRKKPVKRRRTAKQKAATRKLVALNRRRRGGSTKRRKNPVKRKASRRRVARRASPVKRRRRSTRRSNPSLTTRSVKNQVMEAGIGAGGALALDVVQGYLPIPANLKGGIVGTLVKAGLAIGIGILGSKTKLVSNATAGKMANGALTVVLHDELKKQVQNFAPGIQMGEYLGEYLGEYGDINYAGAGFNPDADGMDGPYLPELDNESLGFQQDGFGMGEYETSEYVDQLGY